MLTGLYFDVAEPTRVPAPNRADVACFVGFVARRSGAALPSDVQGGLRDAGWIGGPWKVPTDRLEALWQLPVVVDAWESFDRLYAWDERPVRAGGDATCASYLGAAVRSFFAHGGRRAVVIRTGDPWPYLGDDRFARRADRVVELVPAYAAPARPFDATDPSTWRGIEHLYGLRDVSHVCLPDLADACATEPPPPIVGNPPPPPPEVFVECSVAEPAQVDDLGLRAVAAPRLDVEGFEAWRRAVDQVCELLARYRRDTLFVGALPLPQPTAIVSATPASDVRTVHAETDWLGFLGRVGVLEPVDKDNTRLGTAASAFVQLVWPWLETTRSQDLPENLEPADGLLAGVLAQNALVRGTYRSVAGTRLPAVVAPEPMPDLGLGPDSPTARLAERVCLIGPEPDGIAILSDVTTSLDRAWRPGGVSRLMAALLRAAERTGEMHVFDSNGPELWTRLRHGMEELLDAFLRAGGLGGATAEEAYEVRCDRSTMSQNDLDNGRVRVEITVLPAAAVERITFVLALTAGDAPARLPEVA